MSSKIKILLINDIIEAVKNYDASIDDINLIYKAFDYASEKHFGTYRISGEEYIQHPLNVALILTQLNMDAKAISAALLHDTLEDTDATSLEIEELFGSEILKLVEGVTNINQINFQSENEQMAANHRKILVGLSEDVRVLIIKLADRLHNMRTLYVLPEEKQKKKAKETLEILTPVAHRLGIHKIKSELEDLSLRYLKPDAFYDIVERLNQKKVERDDAVLKMINEVSALLNNHNISHEIKGRSKGIYSIYNKLSKGREWNDIYDLLALRVLVKTEAECYLVLGLIHSKYKPVPKRFKDFIAMPKTNLYQSLHTTVFGIDGKLFEIQIRTYEMNEIAEYGIASHWSYKEQKDMSNTKDLFEQKLQIFRSIIELNEENSTPEDFMNDMRNDILTNDSIFVYTPKGDIMELPLNATPVDFAYKVHSEIGNKMVGAIVNDNIVPLDYKLNTGDIIKINTSKLSKGPSKDWLKFVVTAHAKNRIRAFFSKKDIEEYITKGEELLEKEIRKRNLVIDEILSSKNIDIILKEKNLEDINDLYAGIGSGKYNPSSIIKIVTKEENNVIINNNKNKKPTLKNDVLVEGFEEIKINLASCCKPVPGDNIIGYITKGNGISVHRSSCKNIVDVDERLINVKWNPSISSKYLTDITVYTNGNDNLLDIISTSSANNILIDSITTLNKSTKRIYNITLLIENREKLEKYINDLYKHSFITSVERMIN